MCIRDSDRYPSTALDTIPLRIDMVPSLQQVEQMLSNGPSRRAAGPDRIIEELVEVAPKEVA
eukprot:8696443-Pyramimonas_sp.AAC.1